MFGSSRNKSFGMVLLILVLAAAIYGFAAANTVPDSGAGDGSGDICGYLIENVAYTLNGTDPGVLDEVAFDTTPEGAGCTHGDPATVKVKLEATAGTWYDCAVGTGVDWECDLTGTALDVLDADELRVIAVE